MWRVLPTSTVFDGGVSMLAAWRQVNQLFSQSRGSAGSRILGMLREEGVTIGRFRVRRLMRELGLVSKQPDA